MLFDNWQSILKIITAGIVGYTGLIFLLRITGKRTLSQLNVFDFVITVALGSAFANFLLSKDVTIADGLTGLAVLIFLQYIVSFYTVRSKSFRKLIKSQPVLLYHKGDIINDRLKEERFSREELLQAIRNEGYGSLDEIEAIILETNGKLSILSKHQEGENSALKNVT